MRLAHSFLLLALTPLASGCALLNSQEAALAPDTPAPAHVVSGDPPIVPYKEVVISDDGSFERACLAPLKAMPERLAWTWGDKLLTRTESDGFIWRADYSTARDANPAHQNRIICSVLPNGGMNIQIALDQPVDTLSRAAAALDADR